MHGLIDVWYTVLIQLIDCFLFPHSLQKPARRVTLLPPRIISPSRSSFMAVRWKKSRQRSRITKRRFSRSSLSVTATRRVSGFSSRHRCESHLSRYGPKMHVVGPCVRPLALLLALLTYSFAPLARSSVRSLALSLSRSLAHSLSRSLAPSLPSL